MIQVNLLPDVKLQYIKAQRSKHLVIGVALLISLISVALAVILALQVYVNQSLHTKALQADIDAGISELQSIEDLDTVLTVNQQLLALPELHDHKPAASRIPGLLLTVVPQGVDLTELSIDFEVKTLKLNGNGIDTITINKFADILKNTEYSVDDEEILKRIFANVEFVIGVPGEKGIDFEANMAFDATIFDNTLSAVDFSVPNIISTQSSIRTSPSLFESEEVAP